MSRSCSVQVLLTQVNFSELPLEYNSAALQVVSTKLFFSILKSYTFHCLILCYCLSLKYVSLYRILSFNLLCFNTCVLFLLVFLQLSSVYSNYLLFLINKVLFFTCLAYKAAHIVGFFLLFLLVSILWVLTLLFFSLFLKLSPKQNRFNFIIQVNI